MVIATESTRTFSGNNTFLWLWRFVLALHIPVSPPQLLYANAILRKTGHFTGYAILSWFAFRGWMETLAWQALHRRRMVVRRWQLRAALLAILCTVAVASLDEFHQSFLPGRTGVVRDVVLDTMGGIFMQLLLLLYWTRSTDKNKGQTSASAPTFAR
jgi:VanZ family protein